ncbi:SulA-like leucine-rich domain-containing protein [Pseudoalteromonas sp. MMG012]|uniref:SulA-like leucine-rich domain-containing protein n=1 Tax=Pseudoalteromonas sp. MMG012 TaxID=2822686 RepID=UPI001B39D570|nr:SulA-like leucine-rich domain-containing protein [Pseudoalteromonas sp. MMG012]MBQ4849131.1 hypothetical protein [Pseudoalteromonas sp. MMG012]
MLNTNAYPLVLRSKVHQQTRLKMVHTRDDISANLELLNIIHLCNQKHGWTLLIAPEHIPNKSMLERCSIDSSKLLVIKQKHISNLQYVLNEALNNGNFAAVITWTNVTTADQLQNMNLNLSGTELFCFSKIPSQDTCTIDAMIS